VAQRTRGVDMRHVFCQIPKLIFRFHPLLFTRWCFQVGCTVWIPRRAVNNLRRIYSMPVFNVKTFLSKGVSWLRRLVTWLSLPRHEFMPGSIHVGFITESGTGTGFHLVLRFYRTSISLWLSIFIYHLGNKQ
jgi:hypothetical protein